MEPFILLTREVPLLLLTNIPGNAGCRSDEVLRLRGIHGIANELEFVCTSA